MYVLAFYREGDCLQVALLHKQNQTPEIKLLRAFSLSEKNDVKPLYALASVLEKKDFYTVSALTSTESLFRKTSVQALQKKDVKKALPFLIEDLLPFDKEEGHFVYQITPQQAQKISEITFFATTHDFLKGHLEGMEALEIDPDYVNCSSMGLYRFARFVAPQASDLLVYYFGHECSSLIWIKDKKLQLSLPISMGNESFIAALHKDFPDKTLLKPPLIDELPPYTKACAEKWHQELERAFSFCQKSGPLPSSLLFTSFDAPSIDMTSLIKKHFTIEIITAPEEFCNYSIPIGIGLDTLAQNSKTLQLRKEDAPSKKTKKRLRQSTLFALSSELLLFIVLAAGGLFVLSQKGKTLSEKYNRVFGKSVSSHKELMDNLKKEKLVSTTSDQGWQNDPNPLVSDLLLWMSNLKTSHLSLQLKKYHYTLASYPKLKQKSAPYIPKMTILYSAPSSKEGKLFHELLLSYPSLDSKKEITWKTRGNDYETTFFLRVANDKKAP